MFDELNANWYREVKIPCICCTAPPAIWSTDIPWFTLLMAVFWPLFSRANSSAMSNAAGPSDETSIRLPEDSSDARSPKVRLACPIWAATVIASMLVETNRDDTAAPQTIRSTYCGVGGCDSPDTAAAAGSDLNRDDTPASIRRASCSNASIAAIKSRALG